MSLKNVTNLKELNKEQQKSIKAGNPAVSCSDRYAGHEITLLCMGGEDPYHCKDLLC